MLTDRRRSDAGIPASLVDKERPKESMERIRGIVIRSRAPETEVVFVCGMPGELSTREFRLLRLFDGKINKPIEVISRCDGESNIVAFIATPNPDPKDQEAVMSRLHELSNLFKRGAKIEGDAMELKKALRTRWKGM